MSNPITIGIDIGQKRDPTAICVAELDERWSDHRMSKHFIVRHLERLPLGISYPAVTRRLSEVTRNIQRIQKKAVRLPNLYVDTTGIGQPIIDLLREETDGLGTIHAVYFSFGDRRTQEGHEIRLGKAFLVSRLQMLLQCHRLHLPAQHREKDTLIGELLEYEIRVDEKANDRYGAFRVGTQDDLVTALGLAVHDDQRPTGGVMRFQW